MKNILSLLLFCLVISPLITLGQEPEGRYVPETDPLVLANLEKWQDLKFGLLMHWGTYSQWGIVESWSICAEDEGWCRRSKPDYTEYKKEYENLQTTFNPVQFDPAKWAKAAKGAGMKYVIFTTKHHDGFSMFDTKLTDYKITSTRTPFHTNPKANIAKEIFNAFRAEGFWTGAYFSKPDWHSENYWWRNFPTPDRNVNYDISKYPERWEKFIRYTHAQIMELMKDYGKVDILWLDGGWVKKRTREDILRDINDPSYKFTREQSQDIRMDELVEKARTYQPGLIVVDRAVTGKNQDYLTPENQVPEKALPYPWESCIISGGGWSWVPKASYKSPTEVVHLLADIVSKGGNLLLNIAPGPDGTWDSAAYTMLAGIAKWMNVNSEAIYGTRAIAPYREGKICYTRKKNTDRIYAIYLADEDESRLPEKIILKSICPAGKSKVKTMAGGRELKWKRTGQGTEITVPRNLEAIPPNGKAVVFILEKADGL